MPYTGGVREKIRKGMVGWVSGAQILRFFPTNFGIFSDEKSLLSEQFQSRDAGWATHFQNLDTIVSVEVFLITKTMFMEKM